LRQVEIELHGRELPEPPNGIDQLDVDLRSVERGFARNYLVFDIQSLQNIFKRGARHVPLLFASDETLAIIRIPRGKLGLKLVEAEVF
jgi:hypothetical protein